jgi:hypothetical protein
MEDLSQPPPSQSEPAPRPSAAARRAALASARPKMATHAGARISAIGAAVVFVALWLPWFSPLAGFPYASGDTSSGWSLLVEPLYFMTYGARAYPIFCGLGLLLLALEGWAAYVLIASINAAFAPGIPKPNWWSVGALAVCIALLLLALPFTSFSLTEAGYWLALAGFILAYAGHLLQIRIANYADS